MEDGHSGNALCLQCKFRANVVYSEDRVQDAEASADRLRDFFRRVMVYDTGRAISSSDAALRVVESERCKKADLQWLIQVS